MMPELPEVETVCRSLQRIVLEKKIEDVIVYLPKLIRQPALTDFQKLLRGDRFCDVKRRGKFILLHLASGRILIVHLRMTGKLLYLPETVPVGKHTHVVLHLSGQNTLRYDDVRQFGVLQLVEGQDWEKQAGLDKLGIEPLSDAFTVQWLQKQMTGKKQKAKSFLLDQHNIAGIGNIYADEILFQAHIHPEEPVCNLVEVETATQLWFAVQDRLEQGILYGGSSIKDYVDGLGNAGSFQNLHRAYGRSGYPCVECGYTMEKIISAGRSSTYCPNCQARKKL